MGQTKQAGGPALGDLGVIVIGGGVPRVWAPHNIIQGRG